MFRDSAQAEAEPAPPCSVCRQPSATAFWEGYLCAECYGAWVAAPRDNEAAEFAHAKEHPEDVEASGALPSGRAWVSLKKQPHIELHRRMARQWASQQRERREMRVA